MTSRRVQLLQREVSRKALSLGHCSFRYTSNLSVTLYQPMDYSADDLQVYAHFDLNHSALLAAVEQMEDFLDEVNVCMARILCS